MSDGEGAKSDSKTEGESRFLNPAPCNGSLVERQLWAFRRYHGVGSNGRIVEEWTQGEIATALGVSRQTVNRWLNREPLAKSITGRLSERERRFLYLLGVVGKVEVAEEYLALLDRE